MGENRKPGPNGAYLSLPWFMGNIGGTYYWNPGSAEAPSITLTRQYGLPDVSARFVFLRNGMTSQDTLGNGARGIISSGIPSVAVDTTLPAGEYRPWKSRVTAIEAGGGSLNASPAVTSTYTPLQLLHLLMRPAGGPQDQRASASQSPQTGVATIAEPSEIPVRYLSSRRQHALGDGMSGWASSVGGIDPANTTRPVNTAGSSQPVFAAGTAPSPYLPPALQNRMNGLPGLITAATGLNPSNSDAAAPGGLPGLLADYLRFH